MTTRLTAQPTRVLLLAVLLSACAPWSVIQRAEPNPLKQRTPLALLPLDWSSAEIDGMSEEGWNKTNDEDMKQEWVVDRGLAVTEFTRGLHEAQGRLPFVPGAAPLSIRCWVRSLKTGGIRPLFLTVRAQLVQPNGQVVEEIETTVKENRGHTRGACFRTGSPTRRERRAPTSPSTS